MRKFSYLLIFLLLAFSLLYLLDPTVFSMSFKDLWANLLAGVISVMLIDRIVKHYEKRRFDTSIKYIRKRLGMLCSSLVSNLSPAMVWTDFHQFHMEWTSAIQKEYNREDWKEYYDRVKQSREKALKDVEYILNYRRDLLDDLQNSIFDLKESLEDNSWIFWLGENSRKDMWQLYYVSFLTARTSNQSFNILKEYDLLENQEPRWSEKTGERPRKIEPKIDKREIKRDLERLEWFLNQSISFRDALKKKLINIPVSERD